jgi:fumarate reductase subunit D
MRSLLRKALLVSLAIVSGLTAVNHITISILISKLLFLLLYPGLLLSLLVTRGRYGSGLEELARPALGFIVGFVANLVVYTLLSVLAISIGRRLRRRQPPVKPSASIVAVAVALLLGSLLILSVSLWTLNDMIQHSYDWNQFRMSISTFIGAIFFGLTLLQIAFSLMGIIVSIGLLQLRESARKATIFLSTVPVAILIFSLLLFLGATPARGRGEFVAAYVAELYGAFFLLLLPLSIWWCFVLTRVRVKSQFPEN